MSLTLAERIEEIADEIEAHLGPGGWDAPLRVIASDLREIAAKAHGWGTCRRCATAAASLAPPKEPK